MLPRLLAVLCAATLIPLAFAVPVAYADQSFSGTIDGSEEWWDGYTLPDYATQTCGPAGAEHGDPLPTDTVTFVSEAAGRRRFVLRSSTDPAAFLGMWIYRNGVCVAADAQPGNPPEVDDAEELVIRGVELAVDDVVVVKILGNIPLPGTWHGPVPWKLSVEQPGTANARTTGRGARYVDPAYQVRCSDGVTSASLTKRLLARIERVRSVSFNAGPVRLRTLTGTKLARIARRARNGKPVRLAGVPAGTTSLTAVVTFDNGRKARAARSYSAC